MTAGETEKTAAVPSKQVSGENKLLVVSRISEPKKPIS